MFSLMHGGEWNLARSFYSAVNSHPKRLHVMDRISLKSNCCIRTFVRLNRVKTATLRKCCFINIMRDASRHKSMKIMVKLASLSWNPIGKILNFKRYSLKFLRHWIGNLRYWEGPWRERQIVKHLLHRPRWQIR